MPGFQPHAGKIALNPMHKSYGHVSFFLAVFQNENGITIVFDNKKNAYYTENSNNTKNVKKGEKWLLFLASWKTGGKSNHLTRLLRGLNERTHVKISST